MEWLNYHHLLYFWVVAREGGIAAAGRRLRLSHATLSAQIRTLEEHLGERLFDRVGRRLVLTEMGRVVLGYAEEIFSLGNELLDTVHRRPTGRPGRMIVGVADVLPKTLVRRLLDPALALDPPVRVICVEDHQDRLVERLATHAVDVVLGDAPLPAGSAVRAFSHLLGECGVAMFATRALAQRYRPKFPKSLDGAPFLLPAEGTSLRRSLDRWFAEEGVGPRVIAEFDDSALMKAFGRDGLGVFPAPLATSSDVEEQYGVERVGTLSGMRERYYAISAERRVAHPGVVAITQGAREDLFR